MEATDRIDTRLTVVDWPQVPDEDVERAILELTTFELANDPPTVVEDQGTRHLVWLGYLTGGLLTLNAGLGALLTEHGLSAFFADRRLEVFVPAAGPVVVMGALRRAVALDREEWDRRVLVSTDAQDLTATFLRDATRGADEVIEAAREHVRDTPAYGDERPPVIPQAAPGEVMLELIEDAALKLVEEYEPEGMLESAWVECEQLRWRTDVVAPSFPHLDEEDSLESFAWRARQWEWEEGGEGDGEGVWQLRGATTLQATTVREHLPTSLHRWVRRRTQEAVEVLAELMEEVGPEFDSPHRQLNRELSALRTEHSADG